MTRADAVTAALHSVRMEGLEIDAVDLDVLVMLRDGKIGYEEALDFIRRRRERIRDANRKGTDNEAY